MPDLRPYQKNAVAFCLPRKRAFIIAPAGAGKTIIAAEVAARCIGSNQHIAWIGNTLDQLDQGKSAIAETECSAENVELDFWCGVAEPDLAGCHVVLIDEGHHLPCETWFSSVLNANPNARIFGFSATPWHDDQARNDVLLEFFGGRENFFEISRDEVMAGGHLVPGHVIMHDLDAPGEFDAEIERRAEPEIRRRCAYMRGVPEFEHRRRVIWQITQQVVQQNRARNALVAHLARDELTKDQSVLGLVASIEHGLELSEQIEGSTLCYAKMGAKKRRAAIADFRAGTARCLFATSLADEGLDVPVASVLILVAGGRSSGKITQRTGRVMRPYPGKAAGVVHDFLDRGAKFAHAQARARIKTYRELGYSVEMKSYR